MSSLQSGWLTSASVPKHLGPLELRSLELVWELKECSVSDIVRRMPPGRSYTTIMTTLDRLYQKGVLKRKKADRKFLYSARLSRQELESHIAQSTIAHVLSTQTTSLELIISTLLEELRQQDSELFKKVVTRAGANL
jgi:predicted transcriptional regulator